MPRNPAGAYNLPAGPVLSNTTILASDENNQRNDMAVEIGKSLDREGRGGMLAPLRNPNGSAGAPAFSFNEETNTGLYRFGLQDIRYAVGGADVIRVTPDGLAIWNGTVWVPLLPIVTGITQKNAIIGGNFSINPFQRQTTLAAIVTGAFVADRWQYNKTGAMVHSSFKTNDFPTVAEAGILSNHCLHIDCTTSVASPGVNDFATLLHNIEGYTALPLQQKEVTLSFWHKHTKTGIYSVGLRNAGPDRSCIAEYTQAVSNVWEKAVVTFPSNIAAGGTWNYDTGIGMTVTFAIAAGANWRAASNDTWVVGNFVGSQNQINGVDSTANDFKIALVQLEPGDVATNFEFRTFEEELALCQRFYEKSYNIATFPGAIGYAGAASGYTGTGSGGAAVMDIKYRTRKRVVGTVTIYNPQTGTVAQMVDASLVNAAAATSTTGETGFTATNGAALTSGQVCYLHWTNNAEF
jgi:hypothetical protein